MVSKVFSCTFSGLNCQIIEVQTDISAGLPTFSIVGLGDTSVQESKERVRASLKNSGAQFPHTRKTINLAPAQVRKQGTHFDLPIAVSMLLASQQITQKRIENALFVGELSLMGKIKSVRGVLPITQYAKKQGFSKIFLPEVNSQEASFIKGIEIYPLKDLKQLIDFSYGLINIQPTQPTKINQHKRPVDALSKIIGQEKAKRGLCIAAAGGHNLLFKGSPGCGKTLLCRSFKSLLPPMNESEILETTKLYSVSGLLSSETPLVIDRPFREVHHTASKASIIGGGNHPKPGEISLAHNGVLFFDEIAEFNRSTLETLRQPLEDRTITINRSRYSLKFPSNFIFLATMNPCPCGYKNDPGIPCICTDYQVKNYRKKLSGPLLDRFDLFIDVPKISIEKVFANYNQVDNSGIIRSISIAQKIQNQRFKNADINKNSEMEIEEIRKHCPLSKSNNQSLIKATQRLKLSNRGYLKTLKLARTIADLEESSQIENTHISEAIAYRRQNI